MLSRVGADLHGKVAIITGASRGIGRECALTLAKAGVNVVIAAKTTSPHPSLPGTIFTVADECQEAGGSTGAKSMACQLDLRSEDSIVECVEAVEKRFGRIDILINNASALWWQEIEDTPSKRFDLINGINSRGTFLMTKSVLPVMKKNGFGRVVNMSPPITANPAAYSGRTAYNISKFGMTMSALGVASEYSGEGITANTLWPATIIESLASINFKLGDKSQWRKASIIADATLGIVAEGGDFTGNMLIDDEYLRARHGFKDSDFVQYRCDPEIEPPRLLASEDVGDWKVRRGSVARLEGDLGRSNL